MRHYVFVHIAVSVLVHVYLCVAVSDLEEQLLRVRQPVLKLFVNTL